MEIKILDEVIVKFDGEVLKSGDKCKVIMIERGTDDKPYYCWCDKKEVGEFFNEKDLKTTSGEKKKVINQILK